MAWSTPDLSDVTQVILGLVTSAIEGADPDLHLNNVNISAVSPETARKDSSKCQLTLYLLHVGRDPYWRNTPVSGPRPQLNNAQPLSLNLSYLLTAWHDQDFTTEQRAMSVALQAIHSQPIVTQQDPTLTQWLPKGGEFTMSIEADTIDEMSRLWQAFTVPIRLSALIRVGVVFIDPAKTPDTPKLPPTAANLSVAPNPTGNAVKPLLFAGNGQSFPPVPSDAHPAQVTATNGPLIAVGGSDLAILGNGITPALAPDVFLAVPGTATEWKVTSWRQDTTQPGELDLGLPAAYADVATAAPAPPAATPLPGVYNLTVGGAAPGSRSNAIPLAIAPRVDNVANPPGLQPDPNTGVYSVHGAGFVPATTIVALGTTPLTAAAAPGPGQFAINASGTAIDFLLPSPKPPPGSYPLLIQTNGIAADPGWIVIVPVP
jgi:hypothetical protein